MAQSRGRRGSTCGLVQHREVLPQLALAPQLCSPPFAETERKHFLADGHRADEAAEAFGVKAE